MTEDQLAAIEERCAKAPEGPLEWRLFASAPTNRTEILVYREDAGVFTARYTPALAEDGEEDEDNYCWFTPAGEDLTGDLPTHWMPLPSGPESIEIHDGANARLREALSSEINRADGLADTCVKAHAEIDHLTKENRRLREALGVYANAENWRYDMTDAARPVSVWHGAPWGPTTARAALKGDEPHV